jgi:hypothetical protein
MILQAPQEETNSHVLSRVTSTTYFEYSGTLTTRTYVDLVLNRTMSYMNFAVNGVPEKASGASLVNVSGNQVCFLLA